MKKLIIVSKYRSCHTSDWKQKARSNQFGIKLVQLCELETLVVLIILHIRETKNIKGFLNYFCYQ